MSTTHRPYCRACTIVRSDGSMVTAFCACGAATPLNRGELDTRITLPDRGRGQIALTLRSGIVVGATGSEPERFLGLTEQRARQLAKRAK